MYGENFGGLSSEYESGSMKDKGGLRKRKKSYLRIDKIEKKSLDFSDNYEKNEDMYKLSKI